MYKIISRSDALVMADGPQQIRISFRSPGIVRCTYSVRPVFQESESGICVPGPCDPTWQCEETPDAIHLSTAEIRVSVNRRTGAIQYEDGRGRLLFRENASGGKTLTPREVYRYEFGAAETGSSIDGARGSGVVSEKTLDRVAFEARLDLMFSEDEALFGLGSHEEGIGNLRGSSRDLYQHNLKIAVPVITSTRGYALLVDTGSAMRFRDNGEGTFLWADCVEQLDYYVLAGTTYEQVHARVHELTGPAPLPPQWAFGYVQSKERYVCASEMIAVVEEYRRRQIPLDLIVLDWKSWPESGGWGQKSFDPVRFPDPPSFIRRLHELGARLMVSIWPIMTKDVPDVRELRERGFLLGNDAHYDPFNEEARALYWEQARRGLFSHGVDAWWCDCTEPFETDWQGATRLDPVTRMEANLREFHRYLDPAVANQYSVRHSQGLYEGQRSTDPRKRVLNLTRSSMTGQHRYGTVAWSGDISANWKTLRNSIPEGLNFCATGEPYWTCDIGGFFVKREPSLWFWDGDYQEGCRGLNKAHITEPDPLDTGCRDRGYWELYTRWMQYAVFLPMFRSHGTDAAREIWRFGEEGDPFYDAIADAIRLRYRLMPTIYALAAAVTFEGKPMLRPLALAFPDDVVTHGSTDQFMFGPDLMVCPVTHPMRYERESRVLEDVPQTREVYLPAGTAWVDFWTHRFYEGGQTLPFDAPLERIPLFVRAGSILVLGAVQQYVGEQKDAPYELRIYAGSNATFRLYEDAGDGYGYENGECAWISIRWEEAARRLHLSAREGAYPGMPTQRTFKAVIISKDGETVEEWMYAGKAQARAF